MKEKQNERCANNINCIRKKTKNQPTEIKTNKTNPKKINFQEIEHVGALEHISRPYKKSLVFRGEKRGVSEYKSLALTSETMKL